MQTGFYLNSLICFFIFLFSLRTSYYIYKNNRNNRIDVSYAAFWFFASMTWLCVSASLLSYKTGFYRLDILLNQFGVQTFVFAQIAAGIYFAADRAFNAHKFSLGIFIVFVVLSIIGLYYDYKPGSLIYSKTTYASVEYQINQVAGIFFKLEFAVVMLCMAIDFFRNLFYWFKNKSKFMPKYFFACLAGLLYGTIGYFDQLGASAAWISVFSRSAIICSAIIAYLGYSESNEQI